MKEHTKKLMLIFNIWHVNGKTEELVSEYDNLKELDNDLQEYIDFCKDNYSRPCDDDSNIKKFPTKFYKGLIVNKKYNNNSDSNAAFYGWTILNFETEKFTVGGDSIFEGSYTFAFNIPKLKRDPKKFLYYKKLDEYFRKDDEIPKNYIWDEGEYDGWLQYRWGDGKNRA